jgi:hypothetical protein
VTRPNQHTKLGRPVRKRKVVVSVNEPELELVRQDAKQAGLTISEYARQCLGLR